MTLSTTAAPSAIEVRPVTTPQGRTDFIRVAGPVYEGDPHYVAPLEFEQNDRLNPAKNIVLRDAEHQLWIAWRNGAPVGRIAAIINLRHLERHNDGAGHFGFLEAFDDREVFQALFATAQSWMKQRGMKMIAGPYNLSVNEECGLLIDGFDTPPYVMMPHGRPYYAGHLEALGFAKAMDMYALHYTPRRQFIPERRKRFVDKILDKPHITMRTLRPGKLIEDVNIAFDIFNDAWADNWGFVPFTKEQANHMANEIRPIIRKENFVIGSIDDKPVAFGLALPNINEATADFKGKLLPFNWARLLWSLKVTGVKSSRMPLMGVRKSIQGKPAGAAFAYKIIDMINSSNIDRGVNAAELSWILESNEAMLTMLRDGGARIYKTYRIFEKPL